MQLRIVNGDSAYGTGGKKVGLRINGDSSLNYRRHTIKGTGSAPTSENELNYALYVYNSPYGGGAADGFGAAIIDIPDFASDVKNTTVQAMSGYHDNGSGEIMFSSGLWRSTNAVTSLELINGLGNFVSGSRFSLYGVK